MSKSSVQAESLCDSPAQVVKIETDGKSTWLQAGELNFSVAYALCILCECMRKCHASILYVLRCHLPVPGPRRCGALHWNGGPERPYCLPRPITHQPAGWNRRRLACSELCGPARPCPARPSPCPFIAAARLDPTASDPAPRPAAPCLAPPSLKCPPRDHPLPLTPHPHSSREPNVRSLRGGFFAAPAVFGGIKTWKGKEEAQTAFWPPQSMHSPR